MKARTYTLLCLATALSSWACSDDDSNRSLQSMQDAIEVGRSEVSRHTMACDAADSMQDMQAEMDEHQQNMVDAMHDMDSAMDDMQEGMGCGMGDMMPMMDRDRDMHSEMSDHQSAIDTSGSMAEARAQCEGHEQAMSDIFDDMGNTLDGMGCMMH